MKQNKSTQIQLSASINFANNLSVKGKLSILDGYFIMPSTEPFHFYKNGSIDFKYDGKDYSFPIENLGGKYFVKGRRDGNEYLPIANMIFLNETLEKSEEKISTPKIKM